MLILSSWGFGASVRPLANSASAGAGVRGIRGASRVGTGRSGRPIPRTKEAGEERIEVLFDGLHSAGPGRADHCQHDGEASGEGDSRESGGNRDRQDQAKDVGHTTMVAVVRSVRNPETADRVPGFHAEDVGGDLI